MMTIEHTAVVLERVVPAPPHRVYRAWLDPGLIRRWLAPGGLAVSDAQVDERPGGRYRIRHSDGDAGGIDVGGFECEIVELVPDVRLVFRWGFVGPERTAGPSYDSVLTITLREATPAEAPAGGTVLTLRHERLDALAQAMPAVAANVGPGWESALDKLARAAGDAR